MDSDYAKKFAPIFILIVLLVLAFLLIKPILISIFIGLIFAFIFRPVYEWIYSKLGKKNLSVSILTILLLVILGVLVWLLTPIIIKEAVRLYLAAQTTDFITPIKEAFPSLFSSGFSAQITEGLASFIRKSSNALANSLAKFVINIPNLLLQLSVVLFTFYFALRDHKTITEYIKSVLPFQNNIKEKILKSSGDLTYAIIYGQVIVGILQGVIAGIGFLIFGVPNALLLTLLAILAGVLPVIGPIIVWVPVVIFLIISGAGAVSIIGVTIFGVLASTVDNFLRPLIVSRKSNLQTYLAFIGMIGGLYLLGVVGLIIGPLIIAYLLILFEIYRSKDSPGFLSGSNSSK